MAKRLRVLHFLNDGKIGGQERALYQLFRAFEGDEDVEFTAAVGKDKGLYVEKMQEMGTPMLLLGLGSGFSLNYNPRVIRAMRGYDVHHFHDPSPNYVLYSLMAGRGVRRVFTRRGGSVPFETYGVKKVVRFRIQRALIKAVMHGYSGNTENAANSVRAQYGISDEPVHVLYNGIDFGLLHSNRPREEARAAHGLRTGDFAVGTACRLANWKRVDLLIRAFARCDVERKRLLVFGDGPERERLEALSRALGLGARVRFVGMVPDMAGCYHALDAFVLASTDAESFGNAVVEAMHARVPSVVMADSKGLMEHVHDRKTGYVADGEEGVARLLERIYRYPAEAAAIAEEASRYVVQRYSYESTRVAYKHLYSSVMKSEGRRSTSPSTTGRSSPAERWRTGRSDTG